MIIENVEALKSWLSKLLKPICEADPSALSNYVVALVKKNKPEKDLKALCADQLDVFLQKETDSFVEKLFESLTTKNYLETAAKEVLIKETKLPVGKHIVEKVGHVEFARNIQRKRSPLRIHCDFNESRTREDRRIDDRSRGGEDRFRKRAELRRVRRDYTVKRSHGRIRSCSHRSHSHSYSRSRSRSKSRSGGKTRSGDGESHQCKEHGSKVAEQRKDPENSAPIPGSSYDPPQQQQPHLPACSRGPGTSSSVAMVTPAHLPDSTTESWSGDCSDRGECKPLDKGAVIKQQCHDYDGRKLAEAPGTVEPGRPQCRQLIPRIQTPRPSLIGPSSRDLDAPIRATNIVIQTKPNVPAVLDDSSQLGASEGPPPKKPRMEKIIFNNQHKLTLQKSHYGNTKLEVWKIPRDLNNITKLNEHFRAFGTIVNIQVAFGGHPEAALIQYSSADEARRAIGSTDAVLNNRFIQLRWHRDDRAPALCPPQGPSYSAPAGPPHGSVHKVIKKQLGPGSCLLSETVAKQASKPTAQHAGCSHSVARFVCLQKTAYSSCIMKSTSKTVGKLARALEAQEAMKKKQVALKLQQDMRKVKQKMLEKRIECQKVLINRLERTKALRPEERVSIIKTLKELSEKIGRLTEDVSSPSVATASSARSRTDTQKELLDAELDLHKKLVSGEDTTDMKKKLSQLQVEATRLGLTPAGGKVSTLLDHGRGRGQGARRRGVGGRGGGGHLVVDHRPRTRSVLGVTNEGKVANQAENLKDHTLQMSRHKPETTSEPIKPEEDDSKDESVSSIFLPDKDGSDHDDDDEDDDDEEDKHESRSWRR